MEPTLSFLTKALFMVKIQITTLKDLYNIHPYSQCLIHNGGVVNVLFIMGAWWVLVNGFLLLKPCHVSEKEWSFFSNGSITTSPTSPSHTHPPNTLFLLHNLRTTYSKVFPIAAFSLLLPHALLGDTFFFYVPTQSPLSLRWLHLVMSFLFIYLKMVFWAFRWVWGN